MDIVVTIPKSEYKNDDVETADMIENDLEQFWTLSNTPKRLFYGDRVYFVKNNMVESSMRVTRTEHDKSTVCETTGREWKGKCQIFMDDLRSETHLGIETKGFQGFRYRWW